MTATAHRPPRTCYPSSSSVAEPLSLIGLTMSLGHPPPPTARSVPGDVVANGCRQEPECTARWPESAPWLQLVFLFGAAGDCGNDSHAQLSNKVDAGGCDSVAALPAPVRRPGRADFLLRRQELALLPGGGCFGTWRGLQTQSTVYLSAAAFSLPALAGRTAPPPGRSSALRDSYQTL